jgi:hypothetical protein
VSGNAGKDGNCFAKSEVLFFRLNRVYRSFDFDFLDNKFVVWSLKDFHPQFERTEIRCHNHICMATLIYL